MKKTKYSTFATHRQTSSLIPHPNPLPSTSLMSFPSPVHESQFPLKRQMSETYEPCPYWAENFDNFSFPIYMIYPFQESLHQVTTCLRCKVTVRILNVIFTCLVYKSKG